MKEWYHDSKVFVQKENTIQGLGPQYGTAENMGLQWVEPSGRSLPP